MSTRESVQNTLPFVFCEQLLMSSLKFAPQHRVGLFRTFGRENGCSSPRQNLSGSDLYDQQAMAISVLFTRPHLWHQFPN